MLRSLHISNFALIDRLDIDFGSGLNIITGETGAGKSIIMGALALILGGRADSKAVRNQQEKTIIEATFTSLPENPLKQILLDADIDWDPQECILRRELASQKGRARAFINDTPVNLQTLRDVAIHLVDIHSQHQNLLLADSTYQLGIIDAMAENASLIDEYDSAYAAYRDALRKYTQTRDLITRQSSEREFISFQLDQLREMNIQPGEQEELEQQRQVLANMSVIKDNLSSALHELSRSDHDVLSALARTVDALEDLSDVLPDAPSLLDRLESARLEIADIADTLSDRDAALGADPALLDSIEERLSRIYSLETKHHVDTSDQLIELRERLSVQLQAIDNADATLETLADEAKRAKRAAVAIARKLSERRSAAANDFSTLLSERAIPLGMKNLQCQIVVEPTKLSPSGADAVDFRFAFNKNQPLMSVRDTASGGEISRIILSVKSIIAEKMQIPTIIFDEVDTGVSGDVALRMAGLMENISATSQVIAITHLPQVAAKGTSHYKVYKEDNETATNTHIRQLSDEERVGEIALMLSGHADDPSARTTARTLLERKM